MGFQQVTLDSNNFNHTTILATGGFSNLNELSGNAIFANSDSDFSITHTFNSPQILTKLVINFTAGERATHYLVQVSIDGTNYTTIETVSGMASSSDQEYLISQPLINPLKYKSFRFSFTQFHDSSTTVVEKINAFIPDNLYDYSYQDYNIEFDDSLLDMASWKNARYEGSKLIGTKVNGFAKGVDKQYIYGSKPIIENKVCALFIGNNVQDGIATSSLDPLVEIKNHSYVTIDTVLLVDLDTLESTKLSFEQFNETEEKKESFRRMITDNFPEGSQIVTKILDIATSNQLKESHRVKFNQGLLMKIYAYNANKNGHEDGVFGGFGVKDQKGQLTNNLASGSSPGGGLFGFGMTHTNSSSLFKRFDGTSGFTTITEAPSELSLYGDIGVITDLCPITASSSPVTTPLAISYLDDGFTNTNYKKDE